MRNPFKIPFRGKESAREKFISILVFGLFIFFFLFIFKPFGFSQMESGLQLIISFGFGLVTSFMLFILKFLIEPLIIRGSWTIGKNIIWDFVVAICIGVANYFYISLVFSQMLVFKYLFFAIWTAILVGIIPVTISYIVRLNTIYKAALKEAALVPEEILWESEVVIRAGNYKNEVRLNPKNIIYLCSNDNYVTIVTIKGDSQNKQTIRGTLKSCETELSKNSRFLRCHKCYIVNLDFVESVSGHIQNMKISLLQSGIEIPVSRSKAMIITKRIKKG
jgi:DNA-binding LytR/AlgR family response regulator